MSHINYNHLYYFWHVYKEVPWLAQRRRFIELHKPLPDRFERWKSACKANYLNARDVVSNPASWENWSIAMPIKCSP